MRDAVRALFPAPHIVALAFLLGAGQSVVRGDTLTWNNSATDFNASAAWTSTSNPTVHHVPGINDTADFSGLEMINPNVSATLAVQRVSFGALLNVASGYTLISSPNGQLAIGTGGIDAMNVTGTNTISASLVLNMNESITQVSGGTLTSPVPLPSAQRAG